MSVHKMTLLSLFLALAIALSIAESYIPSFFVPGVKLGLANILILLLLYEFKWSDALFVDLGRVFLSAALTGKLFQMGFFMSLTGALLSYGVMLLSHALFKRFTIYGVSILGSLAHVSGQLFVAIYFLGSAAVLYYWPLMALLSIPTGLLVGFVSKKILDTGFLRKQKEKYGYE
jgi:heptaprenyl diphosphate synthase